MDEFTIKVARSANKELEALDAAVVKRIFAKIKALRDDPRPPGCRKLQGEDLLWRIRIGDYRVVYTVHDTERIVDIIAVRHRRDAYR